MSMQKLNVLLFVCVLLTGSVSSLGCNLEKRKHQVAETKPATQPASGQKKDSGPKSDQLKELAAGNHSTVSESFVLVARDSETYDALRAANSTLPEQSADFFETHAVVAAFLGQRRTGGYQVSIESGPDGSVRISEHAPPKGAMVTMVLSAPFKIAVIPVTTDQPLVLLLDQTWKNQLRSYRIKSGELTVTGGFAGISQRRQLEGTIGIMRAGELATFVFELRSRVGEEMKEMNDAASSIVKKPGKVTLSRISSYALTGAVQSPFRATGEFLDDERELRLNLQTAGSPNVSDNFAATGQLSAFATEPQPSNR